MTISHQYNQEEESSSMLPTTPALTISMNVDKSNTQSKFHVLQQPMQEKSSSSIMSFDNSSVDVNNAQTSTDVVDSQHILPQTTRQSSRFKLLPPKQEQKRKEMKPNSDETTAGDDEPTISPIINDTDRPQKKHHHDRYESAQARHRRFIARRHTLFKKAKELSDTANADVFVSVVSRDDASHTVKAMASPRFIPLFRSTPLRTSSFIQHAYDVSARYESFFPSRSVIFLGDNLYECRDGRLVQQSPYGSADEQQHGAGNSEQSVSEQRNVIGSEQQRASSVTEDRRPPVDESETDKLGDSSDNEHRILPVSSEATSSCSALPPPTYVPESRQVLIEDQEISPASPQSSGPANTLKKI